jgi:hypothetical protein
MNPEKLFDYLEGNLSAAESAQLEEKLATDPQLQRELAIAREMHRRSPQSREVMGESQDLEIPSPESGKLGRRVAIAFILLVFLNVFVGIAFIIGKRHQGGQPDLRAKEAAMRKQLESSLAQTAEQAMPPPRLDADEIRLFAAAGDREAVANNVVLLANRCGGSATKALPDDTGITVLAEIPAEREEEFRRAIAPLGSADFSSPAPGRGSPGAPGVRRNIYVRITDPP